MQRRQFIQGALGSGLGASLLGCGSSSRAISERLRANGELPLQVPALAPIHAYADRIISTNVCTRPFRAQGPRIETETIGTKTVVHNYGHGGSGWSLSWGTAALAESLITADKQKSIAVVGCGAVGLTTAIECQRAGYKVTIYAKEQPPYVRSSFATGIWSPDSRIASLEYAADFAPRWQRMARLSYWRFQTLLGLAGDPVEWTSMYRLSDTPFASATHHNAAEPDYAKYKKALLSDITPRARDLSAAQNPFATPYVRQFPLLMFNISSYSQYLLRQFHQAGGSIVNRTLNSAADFGQFDESIIVNATGYGAKALLQDESITPVRGQTCKLIPQPEVNYGIQYADQQVSVYPRRDGLLVQAGAADDFANPHATINAAESIRAVEALAAVVKGMKRG